jgi:hypothetical protein
MQNEFKFKTKYKKFYENIDVEATRQIFEDDIFKYSPLNDKEGRRIFIIQCGGELENFFKKICLFCNFIY